MNLVSLYCNFMNSHNGPTGPWIGFSAGLYSPASGSVAGFRRRRSWRCKWEREIRSQPFERFGALAVWRKKHIYVTYRIRNMFKHIYVTSPQRPTPRKIAMQKHKSTAESQKKLGEIPTWIRWAALWGGHSLILNYPTFGVNKTKWLRLKGVCIPPTEV